jgi:hypothetical protein
MRPLAFTLAAVLSAAVTLALGSITVGAQAGMSRVTSEQAPAPAAADQAETPTTGFMCPMHPDVFESTPGVCPRCGMTLVQGNPLGTANYRLRVETVPGVVKAGQKTRFRFHVEDPVTRKKVTDYAVVHDMPYHVFVLSRDTSVFMHEHPTLDAEGVYTLEVTLPKPGHYVLISDFFPTGGSGQVLSTPIVTAGYEGDLMADVPTLSVDDSWTKREAGVSVDLRMAPNALVASEDLDLPLHFTDVATGEPVRNLERYLGAFAHALIVNEELSEYIHAHPEETLEGTTITSGGGPDVVFHTLFPKGGRYKAWVQFQRGGKLSTVAFTLKVLRPGENLTP